jgi:hypothetical protein
LFLSNHKNNSGADTNARDAAIAFSFAVQHGADPEAIRRALCRDAKGNASGPLGAALDAIAAMRRGRAMTTMPITDVKVGKRIRKDMGDIEGLADSIRELGLLQPIVVFPDGRLILGERRLRAAKLLGWKEIPVTINRGKP